MKGSLWVLTITITPWGQKLLLRNTKQKGITVCCFLTVKVKPNVCLIGSADDTPGSSPGVLLELFLIGFRI